MKEKKSQPFFARFLENQIKEDEVVKGGATMKYPSDADEHLQLPEELMKY